MNWMWAFISGLFFGFAGALAVARWLFARMINRARERAMAQVSRIFAETMAGLYDDVPANWRGMVEQETYEAQLSAAWRKGAN